MHKNVPLLMLAILPLLVSVPGCDDDTPAPQTEDYSAACQDGLDNDEDGDIDCDDDDCAVFVFCRTADGDADGDTDGDSDTDSDSDTDADGDADSDADADGDADTDADGDECINDDECDDENDCTIDTCNAFGTCIHEGPDVDEDGYVDDACGGTDCNDDDFTIAPGREETCDGEDQDCDGVPDDGMCCLGSDEGVRLTDADGESTDVDVAFSGTNYGMVWKDTRASEGAAVTQIYFGLADGDLGRVGEDVRLTEGQSAIHGPRVVWSADDSIFGVAWTEYRDVSTHVFFIRVDATGAPVGTPIQITSGDNTFTALDVAWDGDEFAVLYHSMNDSNLQVAQVGPDGSIVNPGVAVVAGSDPLPDGALVWAGDQYAVLWIDWMGGAYGHVMLSHRTVDLATGTDPLEVSSSIDDCRDVTAHWDGTRLLVGWADQRDMGDGDRNMEIYFNAVESSVTVCDTDVRVTDDTEASGAPSIVSGDTGVMLAWHDRRDGRNYLLARGVSVDLCDVVSEEVQIAWGDPRSPMLSGGSSVPVVFWADGRWSPRFEIYANPVACRALVEEED